MRAPNITYAFTSPGDTAGVTLEIVSRHGSVSTSAQLLEFLLIDIPKDRIFVLSNATVMGSPGATQALVQLQVQGVTQAGLNFNIDQRRPAVVADVDDALNWQGEVWVQGGGAGNTTIRMFAFFDAAVNANVATFGLSGFIIPHGSVAAF